MNNKTKVNIAWADEHYQSFLLLRDKDPIKADQELENLDHCIEMLMQEKDKDESDHNADFLKRLVVEAKRTGWNCGDYSETADWVRYLFKEYGVELTDDLEPYPDKDE